MAFKSKTTNLFHNKAVICKVLCNIYLGTFLINDIQQQIYNECGRKTPGLLTTTKNEIYPLTYLITFEERSNIINSIKR